MYNSCRSAYIECRPGGAATTRQGVQEVRTLRPGAGRRIPVLIATPIQDDLVRRIRAVDPSLDVVYRPDLIGKPRTPADHAPPVERTAAQQKEWEALLAKAEVLFDIDPPSAARLRDRAPQLRWIQSTSSGVGEWIERLGIGGSAVTVTNAAGVHATALAEYVVLAVLYFAKRMPKLLGERAGHKWEMHSVQTLPGKTIAIISLGRVGRDVARLCKGLGLRVLGTRRNPQEGDAERFGIDGVFSFDQWPDVIPTCDYVVLIVPLTDATRGMFGRPQINAMNGSAVLINIARGAIVDEPALIEALRERRIAGAALDVFSVEPLPPSSPIWELDNVLFTPHNISAADDENYAIVDIFVDNLQRYLARKPLANVVDHRLGYGPPD